MTWINLIFVFITSFSPTDRDELAGIYSIRRKSHYNGTDWSTTTLEINCDATASFSRRTHGGLITWEGTWTNNKDTLTVKIKPIITEDGKEYFGQWDKANRFLIRKNRLTPIDLNRAMKPESYKRTGDKDCS